jgi:ribosomal protein L29
MTSLTQTENKTIEQNLIWLEHEIKINEAIATSQETKAKVNVLSLAISSISELSSTIRELKSEIAELRTEVSVLRSSVKPKMSDEEKEIFREEARERLREIYNEYFNILKKFNQLGNSDKSNLYYNQELLNSINDAGIEIIIIKSKTIIGREYYKRLFILNN